MKKKLNGKHVRRILNGLKQECGAIDGRPIIVSNERGVWAVSRKGVLKVA